jgi:hypothetical protein
MCPEGADHLLFHLNLVRGERVCVIPLCRVVNLFLEIFDSLSSRLDVLHRRLGILDVLA